MSGGTFEDKIWDNIERNSGEQSDPGSTQDDNYVDDNDEPDAGDLVADNADDVFEQDPPKPEKRPVGRPPKEVKEPAGGKPKLDANGKPIKEEQPRRDKNGNLIGPDGKIIAKNGAERRMHLQLSRTRELVTQQDAKIKQLQDELHNNTVLGGLPKELGLDNNDVKQGLAIVSDFIRDPAKAARDVIQLALSRGVSLQQIVNDDLLPNIQLGAMQKMIDQRLPEPKPDAGNRGDAGAVSPTEAAQHANRFLADYPEADIHEAPIARLMHNLRSEYTERGVQIPHPYVLAEMALQRLKAFATANNLNFDEDLGPQLQALQARGGNRQQRPNSRTPNARERQTQPRQQPSRRPMPNGSSGSTVRERSEAALRPDASTDDIVRAAMRENGYDL